MSIIRQLRVVRATELLEAGTRLLVCVLPALGTSGPLGLVLCDQ